MPNNILAYLPATASQTPVADTNRLVRLQVPSGDRFVLSFLDTLQQEAIWTIPSLPDAYQGGTMSLYVQCFMATATAGSINLGVQIESLNPSHAINLETASQFDTVNVLNTISIPSSAGSIFTATINLPHTDNAVAGDMMRIKLMRLAPDAASGLLYVIGANLQETVSTLNIATFTNVSSANMQVGPTSTASGNLASITVGNNGQTGSRYAQVELHGDDVNSYGMKIARMAGSTADSYVTHRGSGTLYVYGVDGGDVAVQSGTNAFRVKSYGALNMPAVSTPGNSAPGDIWNDATQNSRRFNQSGAILSTPGIMAVSRAGVQLANGSYYISQIAVNLMGSLSFPANFFTEGKTIRWMLIFDTVTNNATYQLKQYLGGQLLGTIQAVNASFYRAEGFITYTSGNAFISIIVNGNFIGVSGDMPGQSFALPSNFTTIANQFDLNISIANQSPTGPMFVGHFVLEVLN